MDGFGDAVNGSVDVADGLSRYLVARADDRFADEREAFEARRERVSLVGEGTGAYHALYAAAVDRSVESVTLRDPGPSFAEMATDREYPYDPRLTVFGVVGTCDVPHLLAALDERGVRIERSGTSG